MMNFSTMNKSTCKSVYNIDDINKCEWMDISSWKELSDYAPYMLIHLHKLNPRIIACAIVNNDIFAKGFVRHLISDDNIELYCKVVKEHDSVATKIFEISELDTEKQLANYLFRHLERIKDVPQAINYSIYKSVTFCNLMAIKIMSGDENMHWINKLDHLAFRSMLSDLSDDIGNNFFNFLLNHHDKINGYVLSNASQVDYNFGSTTYNELLSKHIIENKDWKLLKFISGYEWYTLLKNSDKLKDYWKKFILDNIVDVFNANKGVFEHMVHTRGKTFNHELIDKLIEKNIVLVNAPCDVLQLLFKESSRRYRKKLQTQYMNHAEKLSNLDGYVIAQSWDKTFVEKLEKKLIQLNQDGFKSEALQGMYDHKYRRYN